MGCTCPSTRERWLELLRGSHQSRCRRVETLGCVHASRPCMCDCSFLGQHRKSGRGSRPSERITPATPIGTSHSLESNQTNKGTGSDGNYSAPCLSRPIANTASATSKPHSRKHAPSTASSALPTPLSCDPSQEPPRSGR